MTFDATTRRRIIDDLWEGRSVRWIAALRATVVDNL